MCSSEEVSLGSGFESFVTKGAPLKSIDRDFQMICSRDSCHKLCSDVYYKACQCDFVWYCSSGCVGLDTRHECGSSGTGRTRTQTQTVASERVQVRVVKGGVAFDREAIFTGAKRGRMYVRGKLIIGSLRTDTDTDTPYLAYMGELKTIKINGIVSIIPHGKGVILARRKRHVGNFHMGKRTGVGYSTSITGMTMRGEWRDDKPLGIQVFSRHGYEAFGCVHETSTGVECTARDIHDSWKKTTDTVCLHRGVPVIVRKESLGNLLHRFDHAMDIEIETVGKVRFKKTVHWTGDSGPGGRCTDGPLISYSSNNTCAVHGAWHLGSVIPKDRVEMKPMGAAECSCRASSRIARGIRSDGYTCPKPVPMSLPKVGRCRGGRSNRCLKKNRVDKDVKIRGVSKRDMSRDVGDVSGDLDAVLEEGGWALKSRKNHFKFTRVVDGETQNFVCSKTPSDKRSRKNDLAMMKNLSRRL